MKDVVMELEKHRRAAIFVVWTNGWPYYCKQRKRRLKTQEGQV